MKISNSAIRALIVLAATLAITVLVIILFRLKKGNSGQYPGELLLKSSEAETMPKPATNEPDHPFGDVVARQNERAHTDLNFEPKSALRFFETAPDCFLTAWRTTK